LLVFAGKQLFINFPIFCIEILNIETIIAAIEGIWMISDYGLR
jgi:hypothetical protein